MNWGMLGDLVLGMDVPFVSYFVVLLHIFCILRKFLTI